MALLLVGIVDFPLVAQVIRANPSIAPAGLRYQERHEALPPPTTRGEIRRLPPTVSDQNEQLGKQFTIDEIVLVALDHNKYLQTLSYRTPLWQTRIDEAASIFDPMIEAGGIYEEDNTQLASRITAAGTTATSQNVQTFEPPPIQNDNLSWSKRLENGATVQLNYSGIFERLNPAGDFRIVNPAWRSGLSAAIEQPLFRGAGVDANYAKINIARQFYQRAAYDIQQAMNYMVRTVRRAYWDLGHAIQVQRILEEATERSGHTFANERKRFDIGTSTRANVAQARELYQRYRVLELDGKQGVLEQERRLRQLMGIPGFDSHEMIVPSDFGGEKPFLQWEESVELAMQMRPDLAAQRHHIEAFRHELTLRENELQPDVALLGRASVGGLDRNWPGSVSEMMEGDHPGWMVGMVYRRPVNNHLACALLRRARLKISQQQAVLEHLKHDAVHEMQRAYQALIAYRDRVELQRTRLDAANERLAASEKQYRSRQIGELDYVLRAQEAQTAAELGLARARADYRKAVEEWNFQRGAILMAWNPEP